VPESKISAAIVAHRGWVVRFKKSTLGVTIEKYDVAEASDDTICDFGRWLYSDAKNIFLCEQHQQLIHLHKSFHEVAGKIAKLINLREQTEAVSPLLEELDSQSKRLVNLLMALKREI
jgi:hypothetical protein